MPTPTLFTRLVVSNFLAQQPDWKTLCGHITYYDPCRDYTKIKVPEMSKNFGYGYQRELRIAFEAKRHVRSNLEPIFLKIDPKKDFSGLLSI
jgi:hypothetical protein